MPVAARRKGRACKKSRTDCDPASRQFRDPLDGQGSLGGRVRKPPTTRSDRQGELGAAANAEFCEFGDRVILLGPITGREVSAEHFQFRTAYNCHLPGSIRRRQRRAVRVGLRASWPCGDRPRSSATSVRAAAAVAVSPSLTRPGTPSNLASNQFSGEGRGKVTLPQRCVLWANLGGASAYYASGDRCISARKKPEQSGYDARRVNALPR
jgi:hypothetical protein